MPERDRTEEAPYLYEADKHITEHRAHEGQEIDQKKKKRRFTPECMFGHDLSKGN